MSDVWKTRPYFSEGKRIYQSKYFQPRTNGQKFAFTEYILYILYAERERGYMRVYIFDPKPKVKK